MGLTHYWHVRVGADLSGPLERIAEDFRAMLPYLPRLAGPDGTGRPTIDRSEIAFNGPHPEDCESFVFPGSRVGSESYPGYTFDFCKTQGQPYDLAVKVALLIAKLHLGDLLRLDSDSPMRDWEEARELVEKKLCVPIVDLIESGGR